MATTLSVPEAMALLSRAAPELTLDESDVEGLILAVHALAKVKEPAVIGAVGEALLAFEAYTQLLWWPRGGVRFIRSVLTLGSVSREFLSAAIQYLNMLFPALDALTREQRRRLEANEDPQKLVEPLLMAIQSINEVERRVGEAR